MHSTLKKRMQSKSGHIPAILMIGTIQKMNTADLIVCVKSGKDFAIVLVNGQNLFQKLGIKDKYAKYSLLKKWLKVFAGNSKHIFGISVSALAVEDEMFLYFSAQVGETNKTTFHQCRKPSNWLITLSFIVMLLWLFFIYDSICRL